MKHGLKKTSGFTLIELLVVIAIIAILAGLLATALPAAMNKGRKAKATTEISGLVGAIQAYQGTYSRLPASRETRLRGIQPNGALFPDFTYGTWQCGPNRENEVRARDTTLSVSIAQGYTGGYETNNSEVMAILMDILKWNEGTGTGPTRTNPENTQHTDFFTAKPASSRTSPGLGPDGVFRDPWGRPYIISLDLNYDGQTRDAFYKEDAVAAPNNVASPGFLKAGPDPKMYETRNAVMVWSLGPDGYADRAQGANVGPNKDNIVSWK